MEFEGVIVDGWDGAGEAFHHLTVAAHSVVVVLAGGAFEEIFAGMALGSNDEALSFKQVQCAVNGVAADVMQLFLETLCAPELWFEEEFNNSMTWMSFFQPTVVQLVVDSAMMHIW